MFPAALKARGHPVGATGVAQIVDIVWQLRHELPENRQVKNAENRSDGQLRRLRK